MPLIELEAGETERIIRRDQNRRGYVLKVVEGVISIGHSQRYAREGQRYRQGDEGELTNLQNPEQGGEIWVYAHEDAAIDLDTSNFLFDLFGTRRSERPTDEDVQEGRQRGTEYTEITVAENSTEQITLNPTGQNTHEYDFITAWADDDVADSRDIVVGIKILDTFGTTKAIAELPMSRMPLDFDPYLRAKKEENGTPAEVATLTIRNLDNSQPANVNVQVTERVK